MYYYAYVLDTVFDNKVIIDAFARFWTGCLPAHCLNLKSQHTVIPSSPVNRQDCSTLLHFEEYQRILKSGTKFIIKITSIYAF